MGDISSPSPNTFDFIVVGAGPAGILAATRLANSRKHPLVLLVEAGGKNDALEARIDANRWLHRMIPDLNWKYMTEPQQSLNNRLIEYDRGKGLGGGSSINFACWTVPPKDDFDEIARRTGDSEWEWSQAQARFKRLESYHADPSQLPDGADKYLRPLEKDHGKDGPIKVGFPALWEKSVTTEYDAWVAAGYKANLDHNSGNSLGVSIIASTAFRGERSTAADALAHAPGNLHVLTDTEVARVKFNGRTAIGITTIGGRDYYATKEVILSAGSLDTPRILMHSGIGPADQLTKFNIPVLYDNPAIGQHMKDHHHAVLSYVRAPHTSIRREYFQSKEAQEVAMKQWQTDRTGPLAEIACTLGIVFSKLPAIYTSPEFANLSPNIQNYLTQPTVPSFEVIFNPTTIMFDMDPNGKPANNIFIFLMNQQSEGCVLLQSADPATPLKFDPKFLSHPYDRRVVIEATREVLRVTNSPAYAKDTVGELITPKSTSDEDILEFWRENTASTWHMTGTVRMGKEGQEGGSGVDKDFKVHGFEGLRVADMSVVPLLVNAHTQTVAYLTGLMAGDKIAKEYGLEE